MLLRYKKQMLELRFIDVDQAVVVSRSPTFEDENNSKKITAAFSDVQKTSMPHSHSQMTSI
jgi:hypothetical protein